MSPSDDFLVKLVVICEPLERVTARLLTLFAISDSELILALADLGLRVSWAVLIWWGRESGMVSGGGGSDFIKFNTIFEDTGGGVVGVRSPSL